MNNSMTQGSPLQGAAHRFLSKISNASPSVYQAISQTMNKPGGMAGMGDIWDDINKTLITAGGLYTGIESSKREMEIAKSIAAAEVQQAQLEIKNQQAVNDANYLRYQMQQNENMMREAELESQRLLQEQYKAEGILSSLSGQDWVWLGVAGALGVALFVMNQ